VTWLLHDILTALAPLIEALDARGRFRAMRDMPSGTSENPWLIPALLIGLAAVAAAIAVFVVAQKMRVKRRKHAIFARRAGRAGLDQRETELLWAIALTANSDTPDMIVNNRRLFEESTSHFSSSRKFRQAPTGQQNRMRALISDVRGKLGFQFTAVQPAQRQRALRTLEAGAVISAVALGKKKAFELVVREIGPSFLVVDVPRSKVDCRRGDGWLLRYPHGGVMWEFDAAVMASNGSQVVLSLTVDSPSTAGQTAAGQAGSAEEG